MEKASKIQKKKKDTLYELEWIRTWKPSSQVCKEIEKVKENPKKQVLWENFEWLINATREFEFAQLYTIKDHHNSQKQQKEKNDLENYIRLLAFEETFFKEKVRAK